MPFDRSPQLPPGAPLVLAALADHRVEHVLARETAAVLHGIAVRGNTVSVVPAAYGRNLDRLAEALRALGAELRGDGGSSGRQSGLDAGLFTQWSRLCFATTRADVEIDLEPVADIGYSELMLAAPRLEWAPGRRCLAASREDLERIARRREHPTDAGLLAALGAGAAPQSV